MAKPPKKITKKMLAKQARTSARKDLVAWSLAVRERDGHTCQVCNIKAGELTKNGKPVIFNSHHIFAKEGFYSFLKLDVNNGICLCQNHHRYSREISPHRQEFVFFVWFMKNKPEQFEYLKQKIVNNCSSNQSDVNTLKQAE